MTQPRRVAPPGTWCAIPVYNNGRTAATVARACREYIPHVVVVDDGSTDGGLETTLRDTDIVLLRHERRRGKGAALRTALDHVATRGARWLVTLDGDGQHLPEDLPRFFPGMEADPDVLLVGCRDLTGAEVPRASRFGRIFSNLWVFAETGLLLPDTQSGFRAYPVPGIHGLRLTCDHFDFEIEVLVRHAWAGLPVASVPVQAYYPPAPERVSHFDKWRDNVRLAALHARLVARRLWPLPPRAFFDTLLRAKRAPARSAALGVLIGALPTPGLHGPAIVAASRRLRLDAALALAARNLCVPPVALLLSVGVGGLLFRNRWLSLLETRDWLAQAGELWVLWLLGSFVVGPLLATLTGSIAWWWRRPRRGSDSDATRARSDEPVPATQAGKPSRLLVLRDRDPAHGPARSVWSPLHRLPVLLALRS